MPDSASNKEARFSTASTRVLLTSVCRPFGQEGEGDSVGAELFHAQVTRSQGIFSYRQVIRCWAIDYIAANIDAPCVVLHYPSEGEFIREISTHRFDVIGISFVVATYHKVRRMAALVRRHCPSARIVLGGYGTVLSDAELAPYSDFICREEGIGYMRRLLGEPDSGNIRHPYAPIESPRIFSYRLPTKVAHITAGLGCPNGCDFCCTSHYFKRKYVPFIRSGRELYDTIRRMENSAESAGDRLSGFIIIDEDFFIHATRAREFLECVRAGGRPLSIMGFGSVKGLSRFTADEIAEMGFDILWTGFESPSAGYRKLQGCELTGLYEALKRRGVVILSSMIIGFPDMDRRQVLKDLRRLQSLEPDLWQILIYFAFPGTPLHQQVIAENRYLPAYRGKPDYRKFDGFSMHFKHRHFSPAELEALQRELYRDNFERLGPSIVRIISTWFDGWRCMRQSSNPLLRARARRMRTYVQSALPGLYPAAFFGPNRLQRRRARILIRQIRSEIGPEPWFERFSGWVTLPLAAWTRLAMRLDIGQQPRLLRVEYPSSRQC
ncbi:MAG TPA: B12-binding domain-containing radical SAM protein [Desulfobacterales bacterium]